MFDIESSAKLTWQRFSRFDCVWLLDSAIRCWIKALLELEISEILMNLEIKMRFILCSSVSGKTL